MRARTQQKRQRKGDQQAAGVVPSVGHRHLIDDDADTSFCERTRQRQYHGGMSDAQFSEWLTDWSPFLYGAATPYEVMARESKPRTEIRLRRHVQVVKWVSQS